MRTSSYLFAIAFAVPLFLQNAACDNGATPSGIGNDVEPEYIEGGGTSGGSIDGRVNVFVYDDDTKEPIKQAFVMLGPGPEPDFWGITDQTGLITFRNKSIKGPQTLTVFTEGHPMSVLFGLDAANITLSMNKAVEQENPEVDTAILKGKVTGLDKIEEPPQGSFKIAVVAFALPSIFTPEFEDALSIEQPPGDLNLVSPALQRDTYELTSRVGTYAVYGLAGVFTPGQNGEPGRFEPMLMGLTEVTVEKGETKDGVDIDLSIDLDQPAKVTVTGAPEGADTSSAGVILDMGDKGSIILFLQESDTNVFQGKLPSLSGDLADSTFHLLVQAFHAVCPEGQGQGDECSQEPPSSLKIEKDLDESDLVDKKVDDLLPTMTDMKVDTDTWEFSFKPPADADLLTSDLIVEGTGEAGDEKLGNITLFDASAESFELPALPERSGYKGLPSKQFTWEGGAIRLTSGTNPFEIHFEDFGKIVTHMSTAEKPVNQ